jgi:hypothetical protein
MITFENSFETFQQNLSGEKVQFSEHKIFAFYSHLDKIQEINKLNFDADRKKICTLFLTEKYKAIFLNLTELVKYIDFEKKNNYSNLFHKIIKKIVANYENNFQIELNRLYGHFFGNKIYNLIYIGTGDVDIKTQGFLTMHENNIQILKHFIEIQADSNYSKYFITNNFLDMCLIAYNLAFYHIEKRLSLLNGQLSNIFERINSTVD